MKPNQRGVPSLWVIDGGNAGQSDPMRRRFWTEWVPMIVLGAALAFACTARVMWSLSSDKYPPVYAVTQQNTPTVAAEAPVPAPTEVAS